MLLTFTVFAPLASWGEVAVGEVRDSMDRPTRSSMLGLVAGALGVERDAGDAHAALQAGYGLAVHALATGTVMRDFHTAQTASATVVRRSRPGTRRALLAAAGNDPSTIVSRRTLRQDCVATIAMWARPGAVWTLDVIRSALSRPAYVPYAGRKANVIGLPFDPLVSDAASLADGLLAARDRLGDRLRALGLDRLQPRGGWEREVHHDLLDAAVDPAAPVPGELVPRRVIARRDAIQYRPLWLFAERQVMVSELTTVEQ